MLGKKAYGSSTTTGVMGDFGADEWARFGSGSGFGVDNLLYDHFGGKVPNHYFGADPTPAPAAAAPVVPPHQTLADFVDRLKLGWDKITGKTAA
jgi:hypothetical protein